MGDLPVLLLVLRYALTAAGGILVAHGYAHDADVQTLMGAILSIVPVVFGWVSNRQQKAAIINAAVTGEAKQATPLSSINPIVEDTEQHA